MSIDSSSSMGASIVTLETKRLRIEPLKVEDVESVQSFYDEKKMEYFYPKDKIGEYLHEKIACPTDIVLKMCLRNHGAIIIGIILLRDIVLPTIWVAYCLDPAYWNQKYTREGLKAVAGWVFQFNKTCLYTRVHFDNGASRRVLEKVGFDPTPYKVDYEDRRNYFVMYNPQSKKKGPTRNLTLLAKKVIQWLAHECRGVWEIARACCHVFGSCCSVLSLIFCTRVQSSE